MSSQLKKKLYFMKKKEKKKSDHQAISTIWTES